MKLALVVPCYNEASMLPITIPALLAVLEELASKGKIDSDSFVSFVDDGSSDTTWDLIADAAKASSRVHGIKLSRNRGHQNALLAGLLSVQADAIISLDADLQDDLSAIEQMIDASSSGADIVYGVRNARETDSFAKRVSARFYYRLLKAMGADVIFDHADFRLMTRRALNGLAQYRESSLFLRGIIPLIGLPSKTIYYRRQERIAGESHYPLRKMLALALNGITSFSIVPLRLITWGGLLLSLLSLGFGIWALGASFLGHNVVPGWASTVIPIYFLGGLQLLALGIIGEYLAKIFIEVKQRPLFLIEESV